MTVNCADDGPTAVNDTATVAEDDPATPIDVLANDTDTDGGPKAIDAVTQPDERHRRGGRRQPEPHLQARRRLLQRRQTRPTTSPTPSTGGSTATVAVTVNCADDGPTAVNDTATVAEDDPATPIDVLANDTDTDGGPMAIDAVTQPDQRRPSRSPATHQSLTYKPDADYCNDGTTRPTTSPTPSTAARRRRSR